MARRLARQLSAVARLGVLLAALSLPGGASAPETTPRPGPGSDATGPPPPPTPQSPPPQLQSPPSRPRRRPPLVEDAGGGDVARPEDEDEPTPDGAEYDDLETNVTEKGTLLGGACESSCHPKLRHAYCDPAAGRCECDAKHPVQLGPSKGCAKPKKLGEQCFYRQTCRAYDPHASCVQLNHNARCECEAGYHSVAYTRPVQRLFCTEDMALLTADVPTLLGVASGIFVLAGLLCMVLHLYTRARYPRHPTHLADAAMTPPCLYSLNDTGGTISMGGRPDSRSSTRSVATGGTLESGGSRGSRRESRARGVVVSASRAGAARAAAILLISSHLKAVRRDGGAHPPKCAAQGSRRPSMSSMQSSTSSVRSYSMRRFEKEREQKEKRQQMQMRLAQLHANMTGGGSGSGGRRDVPKHAPTPSPRSPNNSTDGLLPAVCEIRELSSTMHLEQGAVGPCSSSSLY